MRTFKWNEGAIIPAQIADILEQVEDSTESDIESENESFSDEDVTSESESDSD